MITRLTLDRYVYEDIYPAFKEATDEKEITAKLSRDFLNYLAQRNLILTGATPAAVADIGCGPCDTLIMYLRGVLFEPGFIVRATDYLGEYADAERGEALQMLKAAQAANSIKLAGFSVRAGDAFGGKLLELLSGPQDGAQMRQAFSLVYASHVMYHAEEFLGCTAPARGCGRESSRQQRHLRPVSYREPARNVPGFSCAIRQPGRRYHR